MEKEIGNNNSGKYTFIVFQSSKERTHDQKLHKLDLDLDYITSKQNGFEKCTRCGFKEQFQDGN